MQPACYEYWCVGQLGQTPAQSQYSSYSYRPEVDSLNETVGRRPQVKLRSRARHWSDCTPRPIEFEHRALDLRFSPTLPVQKSSLRSRAMCSNNIGRGVQPDQWRTGPELQTGLLLTESTSRGRIFKLLRGQGITSTESIPPTC